MKPASSHCGDPSLTSADQSNMSPSNTNRPMPIRSRPDPVDPALAPLLREPFARAWSEPTGAAAPQPSVRGRLMDRVATSHAAESAMVTSRRRRLPRVELAPGVSTQTLYLARTGMARRAGEPLRTRLIELAPGAHLPATLLAGDPGVRAGSSNLHREWLVLDGSAALGDEALGARDYHIVPAGFDSPSCTSARGAFLFLRESELDAIGGEGPTTVRDAQAGWPDFAPGIQRRVLWQRDGQAALLYYAQPGARVPQHSHGHDEECLMIQGELFLDDLLLQPGDYQLAPAGSGHRITHTDTGVVIYAHGDLDLMFID